MSLITLELFVHYIYFKNSQKEKLSVESFFA